MFLGFLILGVALLVIGLVVMKILLLLGF